MNKASSQQKKILVLSATFIVPLMFFLFLASGKVNFNKLPIITERVSTLDGALPLSNQVSVLVVMGETPSTEDYQNLMNLYQVIYKSTAKYKKFQVLVLLPNTNAQLKNSINDALNKVGGVNLPKWKYLTLPPEQIAQFVKSFGFKSLRYEVGQPFENVYIVDEYLNLRGRTDDEDTASGILYAYDTKSVAVLKNKLRDDLKVIFYESKFAKKD